MYAKVPFFNSGKGWMSEDKSISKDDAMRVRTEPEATLCRQKDTRADRLF